MTLRQAPKTYEPYPVTHVSARLAALTKNENLRPCFLSKNRWRSASSVPIATLGE